MYPVRLPLSVDTPKLATLSHPRDVIWELELHAGPHNTLSALVITECLMKALDIVEKDWRSTRDLSQDRRLSYKPGAFIITGPHGNKSRYFSRGAYIS